MKEHYIADKFSPSMLADYTYLCACGKYFNNKTAIKGHIEWQLRLLVAPTKETKNG